MKNNSVLVLSSNSLFSETGRLYSLSCAICSLLSGLSYLRFACYLFMNSLNSCRFIAMSSFVSSLCGTKIQLL